MTKDTENNACLFPGDAREGEGDAGDGGEGEDGQEEQLPGEGQGGQGPPQHLRTEGDKYLYITIYWPSQYWAGYSLFKLNKQRRSLKQWLT